MKKIFLSVVLYFILGSSINASEKDTESGTAVKSLPSFNIDFCTSMNGSFTDSSFDEAYLKINRIRLDLSDTFSDQFSYRIRYSFNKSFEKNSLENVPPSLEYANLQWHPDDRFNLTVGKQFLNCGGYEALGNSLYIREFSDFNNATSFYRIAVTAAFRPDADRNHEIAFQIANMREGSDNEVYTYGLPDGVESARFPFMYSLRWNGYMADGKLNLIYGAAAGPLAKGNGCCLLTCANIYESGPIMAYLDVMFSRSAIDNQQRITGLQNNIPVRSTARNTQYLSLIAKFDYRFHPKWNAYVKGAYETGSIYKTNSIFQKGRYITDWNAQVSLEWLPFTNDKGFKVFLHYIYRATEPIGNAKALNAEFHDIQRISTGVIYVLPVLRG